MNIHILSKHFHDSRRTGTRWYTVWYESYTILPIGSMYVCHRWFAIYHQYTPVLLAYIQYMDPSWVLCHLSRQVGTATTRISRLLRLLVQLCRTSLWSYLVKIWWVVEYCCIPLLWVLLLDQSHFLLPLRHNFHVASTHLYTYGTSHHKQCQ